MRTGRWQLLVAGLLLAGCGGDGSGPPTGPDPDPDPDPTPRVTTVTVSPSSFALDYGETIHLSASVLDQNGQAMSGQTPAWSSSDESVATVSSDGLVTGTGGGSAIITATASSRSGTSSGTVAPFRLESNAMVVDSTELALLSDRLELDQGIYHFQYLGSGAPPAIAVGDVIVGAQGLGFLRTVTSASVAGVELTLETDPATLDDLVDAGNLSFTVDLFGLGGGAAPAPAGPAPWLEPASGDVRIAYGPLWTTPLPAGVSLSGVGVDFSGFDICKYFKEKDPANTCPSIIDEFKIPNGRFSFSPSLDFGSTWGENDELKEFHGIATGTVKTDLAVSLGAKLSTSLTREATLFELGRVVYVQVGTVPVIVYAEMEVKGKFEANATLKGRLQAGIQTSHSVRVGARWDEMQGWQGVLDAMGSFTPEQPNISDSTAMVSITLEAKLTLTPDLNLKFYGVAGPLLGLGPWAKASLTASSTDCGFDSSAGLDGKVGIALADFLTPKGGDYSKTKTLATLPGAQWKCPIGDLDVVVRTTGGDLDPNGYELELDGATQGTLGTNATRQFRSVRLGSRTVSLKDIADNCSVQGANPQTATIQVGMLSTLTFQVECQGGGGAGTAGSLAVSTSSQGDPGDPDGYQVTVASRSKAIDPTGMVTFSALAPGSVSVALAALEPNCSVNGDNPVQTDIVADSTTTVAFAVTCIGGQLDVTTSTSGAFPVGTTLSVAVDGRDMGSIDANASRSLTVDAGDRMVELTSIPAECGVAAPNPVTVGVPDGGTGTATFSLSCLGGDLNVTVDTRGDNGGQATYRLVLDGNDIRTVQAQGGSTTFPGLGAGQHTLELLDVPEECVLQGANPRSVTTPTTEAFVVDCGAAPGRILYRDADRWLWVMNPDGTNPVRVPGRSTAARWSPDGTHYAGYSVYTCNAKAGIAVWDSDTGACQLLVQDKPGSGLDLDQPTWGPGPSQLTLALDSADTNALPFAIAIDTGARTLLFDPVAADSIWGFTGTDWSSDRTKMVFSGYSERGEHRNYLYLFAGSSVVRLATAFPDAYNPRFSPDGLRIAYLHRRSDGFTDVVVADAAGGTLAVVSADLGMNDIYTGNVGVTWSPDGSQLLFGASKRYPDGSTWRGLWIVNADGTDLRQFREGAYAPDWTGPG